MSQLIYAFYCSFGNNWMSNMVVSLFENKKSKVGLKIRIPHQLRNLFPSAQIYHAHAVAVPSHLDRAIGLN